MTHVAHQYKATWNNTDIVHLITIFTNYRFIFKFIAAVGVACSASLIKSEIRLVKGEMHSRSYILIWVYELGPSSFQAVHSMEISMVVPHVNL